MPPEGWDGSSSNHSYDDAGSDPGASGGMSTPTGAVVGSSSDHLTLALPLHSELTEGSPMQDSTVRVSVISFFLFPIAPLMATRASIIIIAINTCVRKSFYSVEMVVRTLFESMVHKYY